MNGLWHNLRAIPPEELSEINDNEGRSSDDDETLVCFKIRREFSNEEQLDHDYHRISGSLRRINLGINELDRLLLQHVSDVETREKLASLKQSAQEIRSYTSHLLDELSRGLGYTASTTN